MALFIGVIRSFPWGTESSSHSFDELTLLSAAEGASLKQPFSGFTKQSQLPGSCLFILLPLFAEMLSEESTTQTSCHLQWLSLLAGFVFYIPLGLWRNLEKLSQYSNSLKLFRKAVSEDTLVLITQPEFWTAKAECWNFYSPMHLFKLNICLHSVE